MTTVSFITLTNPKDLNMSSSRKSDIIQSNIDSSLRRANPADIFLGKPGFTFVDAGTGKPPHSHPHSHSHLHKNMELHHRRSRGDDLYQSFRVFLLFGRFIGLIPIEGLFQNNVEVLKFSKSSLPALISITIWGFMGASTIVGLIGMGSVTADNAGQYAWAPAMLTFYGSGLFLYYYFYKQSQTLINLFSKWNSMSLEFTKTDATLFRDVNVIAGITLTSAILENAVGHLKLFPVVANSGVLQTSSREKPNSTAFEIYYYRSHDNWAALVPYSAPMAFYVFICNKLALYSWNFMDCIICLFSRAIYFRFKALYEKGELALFHGSNNSQFDTTKWRQLTADHETLCKMLSDVGEFLSPLIFLSFALNIYYVCLQINLGLTPSANNSAIASVYAVWSFVHLIFRVYIVSLAGSRINDWAHKIVDLCRICPNEAYITEVERAERFVSTNQIGLSGLGCFCITKPLILQIVGVVFTFEIVLLQANQTTLTPTTTTTAVPCKT